MTTLGHALRQRGHRVTLVGISDAEHQVRAAGLEYVPIGLEDYPYGSTKKLFNHLGELSGTRALRATVDYFKHSTAMVLQQAPSAMRERGVEAVLIDQTSFAGPTVAHALDLPFVSVSCALLLNSEAAVPPANTGWAYSTAGWARLRNRLGHLLLNKLTRPIADVVIDYRKHHDLPALTNSSQAWSPLAQICQQPAAFEYPRCHLPEYFHFTGPLVDPASRAAAPFPWDVLSSKPLIYASLGTIQNKHLEVFARIAEACYQLDAQLVIALGGGSSPEALPPLPGKSIVVEFAPQLELLQQAALTITHAGLNTVLESLSCGVPMVAIPIANDQPGVAARVSWTGSGAVVPIKAVTVQTLRSAINRVWNEPSYRKNAQRLQKAIAASGGVSLAADIVEQAIRTGVPVLSKPGSAMLQIGPDGPNQS